jgi:hypothetical protein
VPFGTLFLFWLVVAGRLAQVSGAPLRSGIKSAVATMSMM